MLRSAPHQHNPAAAKKGFPRDWSLGPPEARNPAHCASRKDGIVCSLAPARLNHVGRNTDCTRRMPAGSDSIGRASNLGVVRRHGRGTRQPTTPSAISLYKEIRTKRPDFFVYDGRNAALCQSSHPLPGIFFMRRKERRPLPNPCPQCFSLFSERTPRYSLSSSNRYLSMRSGLSRNRRVIR